MSPTQHPARIYRAGKGLPLSWLLCSLFLASLPVAPVALAQTVALSEIRIDQPSDDNDEYFELAGAPGTSLDGLTYLVIGDGTGGSGVIEVVVSLTGSSIPASGFFVVAEGTFSLGAADLTANLNFENSDNVTHLLVDGFTGANGNDLDTNDDGVLDVTPWSQIVDRVALIEEDNPPSGTEFHYGPPTVGPDGTFVPGHAYFCPDGWRIGSFDPAGGDDTPGAANPCAVSVTLSEIRIDQPSDDNDEYFELAGTPGDSLDGLTYLVIGDGAGGSGVVEAVVDLTGSVIPASGFFVASEATFTLGLGDLVTSLNFENSDNVTHLVVRDFTGADGDDLDVDDDGLLDVTPWSEALDCVALIETVGSGELTYCSAQVGPDGSFVPGHVYLCPDGWRIGPFDPAGGDDTPGAANACTAPVELVINEIDYDQPGTDAAEFVEIKNVGSGAADLTGVELQLINGSGATVYNTIALPSVSLPAGGYFVVCGDAANVANCDLDASPDTNLIQNGAPDAVALVLGGVILDTVSYEGDTAAPYTEGSGAPTDPGGTGDDFLGISRCPDGSDTGDNSADFELQAITPGAANDCAGDLGTLVINELDYDQDGTDTAEFIEIKNVGTTDADLTGVELQLVNGNGGAVYNTIALPSVILPAGGYFVVCGDSAQVFNCDLDVSPDTNLIQNGAPDAVALVFSGAILDTVSYEGDTVAPYTEGSGAGLEDDPGVDFRGISRFPDGVDTNVNNVDFSPRCVTPGSANAADATDCTNPAPPRLVVNEVDYDQPGGDTAEFVEIKNAGDGDAELGGVVLELVNGSGATPYQSIPLPAVTLSAGDYFVVCSDAATVAECDLEAISSIQNGAPDAVALTFGGSVLDTVSYEGDVGAPYTEGSGVGLEDSGDAGQDFRGIGRFPDGVDTNANNVDFVNACITPGRANTSLTAGCTDTAPLLEIFDIQGSGSASPFAGQSVRTVDNAVTAVGVDGFFIQTPTARSDGDVDTSDGIFVFTGGVPLVAVGDQVDVTATVVEFFNFTELSGATIGVTGVEAVPAAVVFDATVPSPDPTAPSCAIEFECYEGMLVSITGGTVTGPNQSFGTDPIAEVHITASPVRALREPGVEFPGLGLPPIPTWDGNPEVFELDPDKLGLPNQIIPAGSTFDAVGAIGFEFGGYELWPSQLSVTPAPLPVPVRPRDVGEMTVGSLNVFRLFDDVNDGGETVVSSAEYARRLTKFSQYIRLVLGSPDILAVQEAEKLGVLQDLAALIAADDPTVVYTAHLIEGNDVGGIDVGFLTRDTIAVDAVTQLGATEILTFDGSLLHDRPPLLLEARCVAGGGSFPIQVMAIHSRSLGGIDDPADGPRVRQKRLEQAQSIAQKAQDIQVADPGARLVVIGDFNAYEFTDGYVDVTGQMKGDFVPAENLVSGPDLVDPNLTDQVLSLPAEQRYSFVFQGNGQVLDHALTTASLDPLVRGFEYGRGNADAALELLEDDTTPLRASDHDGMVLYIAKDGDGDGVTDDLDVCPGTEIPESVPTRRLLPFHYALTDGDTTFDTVTPPWWPHPVRTFTTEDTGGCSCEQIIDALHLGNGFRKFGCNAALMAIWEHIVNP